jgi:hypothetical protein
MTPARKSGVPKGFSTKPRPSLQCPKRTCLHSGPHLHTNAVPNGPQPPGGFWGPAGQPVIPNRQLGKPQGAEVHSVQGPLRSRPQLVFYKYFPAPAVHRAMQCSISRCCFCASSSALRFAFLAVSLPFRLRPFLSKRLLPAFVPIRIFFRDSAILTVFEGVICKI